MRCNARSPLFGSNLRRSPVATTLEWIDAGWQLGGFGSTGGTFLRARGNGWRMVTPSDLRRCSATRPVCHFTTSWDLELGIGISEGAH
jgi:hypothetical protein